LDGLHRVSAERHSRMTDAIPLPFDLPSVHRKKLTVDFDGERATANSVTIGTDCLTPLSEG
jgi:hypothetical protein